MGSAKPVRRRGRPRTSQTSSPISLQIDLRFSCGRVQNSGSEHAAPTRQQVAGPASASESEGTTLNVRVPSQEWHVRFRAPILSACCAGTLAVALSAHGQSADPPGTDVRGRRCPVVYAAPSPRSTTRSRPTAASSWSSSSVASTTSRSSPRTTRAHATIHSLAATLDRRLGGGVDGHACRCPCHLICGSTSCSRGARPSTAW